MTIQQETFDVVIDGNAPYGFRLVQKLMDNSLVVSKLRQQGKAWEAGLMEGDVLVAVNNRNCEGFSCTQALNLIDASSLPLVLSVRRKTGSRPPPQHQAAPVRTGYVPLKQTSKPANKPLPWEANPPSNQSSIIVANQPHSASPSHQPLIPSPSKQPFSPSRFAVQPPPFYSSTHSSSPHPPSNPSPLSFTQPPSHPQSSVTRQFKLATTSHQAHEATKVYVGSTRHSLTSGDEQVIVKFGEKVSKKIEDEKEENFRDAPLLPSSGIKYPTIEEQVQLARRVAQSVLAPINSHSKGHKMFLKAKERAAKYTTGADEEDVENAFVVPGKLHDMAKKIAYVPRLPTETTNERINAMSLEEIELLKLQERKNLHTGVSPQVCFNLASDLKNMRSKGGKMFAKRQAKAKSWTLGGSEEDEGEGDSVKQKKVMDSLNIKHSLEVKANTPSQPQLGYGKVSQPLSEQHQDAANRLENLIKATKSIYSPWDAAVRFGNVDKAFEHLQNASPMSYSARWEISDLEQPSSQRHSFTPHSTTSSISQSFNPVQFNPSMAYSDL